MTANATPDPLSIARSYIKRGWSPIPVPLKTKKPVKSGWQKLRITEENIEEHFSSEPSNVSVLPGAPSSDMADVDLDCSQAIALAPRFLPNTRSRFGRKSAPNSHLLFTVPGGTKSLTFKDPTKASNDDRAMLLEIRSTGRHTLFPGSTHPNGELISWSQDGELAEVDEPDLLTAVHRLAAASLLARFWPKEGARNEAAMSLSGGLRRAGWESFDVREFVGAVAAAGGDNEVAARERTAESTCEAFDEGTHVYGLTHLGDLIGKDVISSVRKWLGIKRESKADSAARQSDQEDRASQASQIVDLVKAHGVDLFHDADGEPFVSFQMDGHLETWLLRSKAVKTLLARLYYLSEMKAPNAQAITDALQVLEGDAKFAGPERAVFVRLADHEGVIYLDLGNGTWSVVAISPGSWEIVEPGDIPIRFRRPKSLTTLPVPHRRGSVDALRPLVNVAEREDWILLIGWLIGCLYPLGPRAILQLLGEQGTAKSTVARILRGVVDPNTVPLRSEPKDQGDLLIAANNGLIVALDNLSKIPDWLSDALCRLATGGGLSKRELYTDLDEILLDARRPVLLTAISEVAVASDLLDRCLTVTLQPIGADDRKTEVEIDRLLAIARPAVLGGLLDAAAGALDRLPTLKLDRKPRMADFATWVEAAAPSLGWEPGEFLDAMDANRKHADAVAIESIPLGPVLLSFMDKEDNGWQGTASQLLEVLNGIASEDVRKERGWPKRPNSVSAQLRRLAPNLRRIGIGVGNDRRSGNGQRLIILTKISEVFDRHYRHNRHGDDESGTNEDEFTDDPDRHGSSHHRHSSSQPDDPDTQTQAQNRAELTGVTICDDSDDGLATFSRRLELFDVHDSETAEPPLDPADDEVCEWTA